MPRMTLVLEGTTDAVLKDAYDRVVAFAPLSAQPDIIHPVSMSAVSMTRDCMSVLDLIETVVQHREGLIDSGEKIELLNELARANDFEGGLAIIHGWDLGVEDGLLVNLVAGAPDDAGVETGERGA